MTLEAARADTSLINHDLAPVSPEQRTWGVYNYAALWVGMSVCIPTYMLASSLIAGGMNSWQSPSRISFRTGGLITGVFGILMIPWKLLSDPDAYIFGWLVGYSSLLGPIAGGMIADYFLIRRCELDVPGLYSRQGPYSYTSGVNGKAIWAFSAGVAAALSGLASPSLHWLYDYAWFVGFGISGLLYGAVMRNSLPKQLGAREDISYSL